MKINDINIKEYGFKVLVDSYNRPPAPPVGVTSVKIPGAAGELPVSSDTRPKPGSVKLLADTKTKQELEENLQKFIEVLFDTHMKVQPIKVEFDEQPNKWEIVYYVGELNIDRIVNFGIMEFPFINFESYKYATSDQYNETFYWDNFYYGTGLIYPNEDSFKWIYRRHMSGLYNHSHFETPIAFSITGDVINPRIELEGTGEYMQFEIDLKGRTLNIKDDYTIDVDGQNGFPYLKSGDFFVLKKGENGLIFKGVNPNATVNYKWKHRF